MRKSSGIKKNYFQCSFLFDFAASGCIFPCQLKYETGRISEIMKISTKGRYGLRILIDLATHDPGKPRMLKDIAASQQISEKYISRLVIDLRRARLIRSVRGVNGGFHLAKRPEEITLLQILETMEGSISVVDCVRAPEKCTRNSLCPARNIWMQLNDGIRDLMKKITLEDILDAYREQNAENGICDYCI